MQIEFQATFKKSGQKEDKKSLGLTFLSSWRSFNHVPPSVVLPASLLLLFLNPSPPLASSHLSSPLNLFLRFCAVHVCVCLRWWRFGEVNPLCRENVEWLWSGRIERVLSLACEDAEAPHVLSDWGGLGGFKVGRRRKHIFFKCLFQSDKRVLEKICPCLSLILTLPALSLLSQSYSSYWAVLRTRIKVFRKLSLFARDTNLNKPIQYIDISLTLL